MTFALGGPKVYTGRSMAAAHAKLIKEKGLKPQHFDTVATHLIETLESAGVGEVQPQPLA